MKNKGLCLIFMLAITTVFMGVDSCEMQEEVNVVWENVYADSAGSVAAQDIVQTSDGGYVFSGRKNIDTDDTNETVLNVLKTDADGGLMWRKSVTVPGDDIRSMPNGEIVVASIYDNSIGLVRLDADGQKIQNVIYETDESEKVKSIDITDDGGAIFAFYSDPNDNILRAVKIDAAGNFEWAFVYSNEKLPVRYVSMVQQTKAGDYFAVISARLDYGYLIYSIIYLLKFDASGELSDPVTLDRERLKPALISQYMSYYIQNVEETEDGNYIISGSLKDRVSGEFDWGCYVRKVSEKGNKLWEKCFFGEKDIMSFTEIQNGDVVFTGRQEIEDDGADYDALWVGLISSNGNILFQQTLGEADHDACGYSVTATDDSGFVVLGNHWENPESLRDDLWVLTFGY